MIVWVSVVLAGTITDTACVVVIFRFKVSSIMSVDGFLLRLLSYLDN